MDGCSSNKGPATNAYMQAYQGISSDLSNKIRSFPRLSVPPRPVPPANPTSQESRFFNVATRSYVTVLIEYYGEVIGRSQNLSKFYSQTQTRFASLNTGGVEPDAVKLVTLREETMEQRRELFVEMGPLADLARTALEGRRNSGPLDDLLTGVFGGAIDGAYAGFARGGSEKEAAIGVVLGALRDANNVISRSQSEKEAIGDQIARVTAVAIQLQRDIVAYQTEHEKVTTGLEAKYPDLDWSMMLPKQE